MRPINRFIGGPVQDISITRYIREDFRWIRFDSTANKIGSEIDLGPRHRADRDGWFMPLLFRGRALIVRQTRWKHVRRTRNTQRNSTGEGPTTFIRHRFFSLSRIVNHSPPGRTRNNKEPKQAEGGRKGERWMERRKKKEQRVGWEFFSQPLHHAVKNTPRRPPWGCSWRYSKCLEHGSIRKGRYIYNGWRV